MIFKAWHGFCLCAQEALFPEGAIPVTGPFHPLVFLVRRDPMLSRGYFAISQLGELYEPEGLDSLLPCQVPVPSAVPGSLGTFVAEQGASVLNVSFANGFSHLLAQGQRKREGFRVTLVGLGDVGGAVLTGLVLLGKEIAEIAIYDPNQALCARYEMEMNQILPVDDMPLPRVTVCREEDLFRCDLLAFTASRGVPGLGSSAQDVRMAQLEANRTMIAPYARRAREAHFQGIFCQISDPVDHLAREVFLQSNRDERGCYDFAGLLPEQVQGFGLGVMWARAAYFARQKQIPFDQGRVYGPHGQGLVVANHWGKDYEEDCSQMLTALTREANLRVRDLGFKPYIAPGLSSAAVSLVRLLRGEVHYGSVPCAGAYFGCRSQFTPQGMSLAREALSPDLMARLRAVHASLRKEA